MSGDGVGIQQATSHRRSCHIVSVSGDGVGIQQATTHRQPVLVDNIVRLCGRRVVNVPAAASLLA